MRFGIFVPQGWKFDLVGIDPALIRPLSAYNGADERHIDGYVPDAATLEAQQRAEEAG